MAEFKPRLANLSALPYIPDDPDQCVITVRLSKSLHEQLLLAADRERTSLNLLCVSKLIAAIMSCPIIPKNSRFYREEFAIWRDKQPGLRRCRVCGCTQENCQGCIERTGAACHWVEWDLCSACLPTPAQPLFKG